MMTVKDSITARRLYLILGLLFVTSLIVSNLVFKKFFYYYPFDKSIFGVKLFEISVGILPYPITFLITDLISEIYGKKKANEVVVGGIFASFFAMGIIFVSNIVPATSWSPVSDDLFSTVFGSTSIAVFSSMLAYLFAQFIDIQIYHFWKKITRGKHLWLRNNFSTFSSQLIDTATVLILLCSFGEIQWSLFTGLLLSGFIFKVVIAALDTPVLYICVFFFRKRFKLELDQEIELI